MTEAVPVRGSRKHVLDWTSEPSFVHEMSELLSPAPITVDEHAVYMPRGYDAPEEARLERFGPTWLPGSDVWSKLREWWLVHQRGANTPNWDILLTASIEDRPALVLAEAKANRPELGYAGKPLDADASWRSKENHARIHAAIREADRGWKSIDPRVSISADSHYQLANRLAFTWKLATLGFPVVLVYLGFTGDGGIIDAGEPFEKDAAWSAAFADYTHGVLPLELLDRRIEIDGTPVWLLSRSRPVLEVSTPRRSRATQ